MTLTYYQQNVDRPWGLVAAGFEKSLETAPAAWGATLVYTFASTTANRPIASFFTPAGEPGTATWPAGTYSAQINVSAIGASVTGYRSNFYRSDSALAGSFGNVIQSEAAFTGTGLKLGTIAGFSGTPTATDRYGFLVEGTSSSTMSGNTLTLSDSGTPANVYADGPWGGAPPAADRPPALLQVRGPNWFPLGV